jgi:hypothetical protein
MNVPQYRNFGTYQALVCCHTVDVDATDHAGVRCTNSARNADIRQLDCPAAGTYAPTALHAEMGSIMLNGSGHGSGLFYFSSTVYPGIGIQGNPPALMPELPELWILLNKPSRPRSITDRCRTVGGLFSMCVDLPIIKTFGSHPNTFR